MKWHEWDFVMIIPNPDRYAGKEHIPGHYLEDSDEAVEKYRNCFKQIYRENQVEMKRERISELEVVRQITEDLMTMDDGSILNRNGGRFRKTEHFKDEIDEDDSMQEGGEEDAEVPNEEIHAQEVRDFSVNDTQEEDLDPFVDTRVY